MTKNEKDALADVHTVESETDQQPLIDERRRVNISADIAEWFMAGGEGWEDRINDALREQLAKRKFD